MQNKAILAMIPLLASFVMLTSYADTPSDLTLVSGVPLDQVDPAYKNIKVDNSKDTVIIYVGQKSVPNSQVQFQWMHGVLSLNDGVNTNSFLVTGSCLQINELGTYQHTYPSCSDSYALAMDYFNSVTNHPSDFLVFESKN
jgi:hypothetical protein